MIPHYDRSQFGLVSYVWSSAFATNMVAIYPPGKRANPNVTITISQSRSKGLPLSTIVDIVAIYVVLYTLLRFSAGGGCLRRRRSTVVTTLVTLIRGASPHLT
jgi:hypothetical protein